MDDYKNKNKNQTTTGVDAKIEENEGGAAAANSEAFPGQLITRELRVSLERMDTCDPQAVEQLSDSSVSESLITIRTRSRSGSASSLPDGRLWSQEGQKRRRLKLSESSSDGDSEAAREDKPKARGRPPTSGKFVGMGKAQADLKAAKEEFRRKAATEAEEAVANMVIRMRPTSQQRTPQPPPAESQLASALHTQMLDSTEIINTVIAKSGNLKGTHQRKLKDAVAAYMDAAQVLMNRTSCEEIKKLETENSRLQAQMMELRRELGEMRSELRLAKTAPPPQTSTPEEVERDMMVKVGTMVNARLEALEDRLLPSKVVRPPLAADKKTAAVTKPPQSTESVPESSSGPAAKLRPRVIVATASTGPKINDPPNTGKGRKKRRTLAAVEASASRGDIIEAACPLPSAPQPSKSSWNAVGGKGAKGRHTSKGTLPARSEASKLRPPRSAAIVLTLKPEAEQRGVTYAKVLAEARSRVNLAELGIEGMRFKTAATGARILELPGATNGDKADALANALREVLGDDVARVDRPTKTADVRLTGLDDSVDVNDVIAAVVDSAECPAPSVKCGEIRRDIWGLGSVLVRCPVAAAKKICESGRLKVGWVIAQVKLLPARPMRCYRCLELGHVKARCEADVDRSDLCYRCGQAGHKAGQCTAEPHCVLCAVAGKAANHRTGNKSCNPPKTKNSKKKSGDGPGAPSPPSCPPASEEACDEVVSMDITQQ
jgi:hypothetical protein